MMAPRPLRPGPAWASASEARSPCSLVVFAVAMVFLTADRGRWQVMIAKARAADIAEQAARAAAGNIDIGALRAGGVAAIGPGACGLAAGLVSAYSQQDSSGVDRVMRSCAMTSCSPPTGHRT